MTKETSDIDKVFRDRLYDHKSEPNPESWKAISSKLDGRSIFLKRKRRQILYAACAASLFILLAGSWFFLADQNNPSSSPNTAVLTPAPVKVDTAFTEIETKTETQTKSEVKPKIVLPPAPASPQASITFIEEHSTAEKKDIHLPDGSLIVLNHDSKIRYDQNFKENREVYLSGEAFFDVKPDASHPFVIHGNLSQTEVKGTSFIIRSYVEEGYDEINVTSGKVSFGETVEKGNDLTILAGNKGTLQNGKILQAAISDLNYNAWLTEKIVFKNTKLKEVFKVLENCYNITVTAKNAKILNCEFTGEFEKSDINDILQVLSVSFDLSFNKNSQNYTLSGKGCR